MTTDVLVSEFDWIIGSHIGLEKTLTKTLSKSIDLGQYAFQVFLGSPQALARNKVSSDDSKKFLELKARFPTKVFTHFPYVANLAGSKDCLAWSGNDEQDKKTLFTILSIQGELEQVARNLQGQGVVLHPGCFTDKTKGCEAVSKSINKIEFQEGFKLILENMAGQGSMLGSTLEELALIRNGVCQEKRQYIGFCIDTAHLWGKGLYDLGKIEGIDTLFEDLEKILGISNIVLFHLNDSKVKLGSKVDRHELIGEGEIWGGKMEVLRYFLDRAKTENITCILETDPCDMQKIYQI